MKLRYQLRGIGIGLLVTTIILTISHAMKDVARTDATPKETQSGGSIIAFDKDSIGEKETYSISDDKETEGVSQATGKETDSYKETAKETQKQTENVTQKPTQKPTQSQTQTQNSTQTEASGNASSGKVVKVHIVGVYYASKASDILYNAGVITDKAAFTKYLGETGYAEKISEGYYDIKVGDSFENIAKIITRSK